MALGQEGSSAAWGWGGVSSHPTPLYSDCTLSYMKDCGAFQGLLVLLLGVGGFP